MKAGDLQVWWIPQVGARGIPPFQVDVPTVEAGVLLLATLARYDKFQLDHRIKPDYCNTGGLRRWCDDSDGDGYPGWENWYDEETGNDDPSQFVKVAAPASP